MSLVYLPIFTQPTSSVGLNKIQEKNSNVLLELGRIRKNQWIFQIVGLMTYVSIIVRERVSAGAIGATSAENVDKIIVNPSVDKQRKKTRPSALYG